MHVLLLTTYRYFETATIIVKLPIELLQKAFRGVSGDRFQYKIKKYTQPANAKHISHLQVSLQYNTACRQQAKPITTYANVCVKHEISQ